MIEITNKIPQPKQAGRPSKYPFRDLQIGQSFMIANMKPSRVGLGYWRAITGFKFISRSVIEDGVTGTRIWRRA